MIISYMGKPGAGMTLPSTPPVENSNPERVAPQGADGQGVCTSMFRLHMSWPVGFSGFPESVGASSPEECGLFVARVMGDGATVCSVELL